jgi:predicted RNase H-like nuclease (RuvC/YqgF family)
MDALDLYEDLDIVPTSKEDEIVNSEKVQCSKILHSPLNRLNNRPDRWFVVLYFQFKAVEAENATLRKTVAELKKENEELRAANETLKRNIGSLHTTAKAELERRTQQLRDLQNQ